MSTGRDLKALPKAHLHLHLEGGMRMETLRELAARYGIPLTPVGSYTSFTEFSQLYEAACEVMRTHDDLRRLMRESVEDAVAAGAVWVEAAVRPTLHRGKFGGDADVLETLLEEGRKSGAEMGVGVGVLMTVDRTAPLAIAFEEAELAVAYADAGVVSFGLANDEVGHPPEPFAEPFAVARDAGLLSCPHAGELDGPASITGALDALGADRIQHGIRCLEDPALVERLAAAGTCLDVCPTSNAYLKIVPSIVEHPLPRLLDAGIRCSLNADDPLFFGGVGLLQEYELARDEFGLSDEQLAGIARSSIDASGAPQELKASANTGIDDWLASAPS
ncbi:MAG TPA: adenosine deaminase [Acidimicrobiales bacterium]|nr:adenosine deaminase [Acidimicrobiales bacterium]